VLRYLADGLTDREIGAALTISPRTVGTHVSSILHKLGVRNRAEAARRYRDRG
jgi:DNA-binding NarL/FixJ family response regulator